MYIILRLVRLVVILCKSCCCCWGWWSSYACHLAAVGVGGHLMHIMLLIMFGFNRVTCNVCITSTFFRISSSQKGNVGFHLEEMEW